MDPRIAPIRTRLSAALTDARRRRDRVATSALRSVLGAIDNATAVDAGTAVKRSGALEDAAEFGESEVPRRVLSHDEILALARSEIAERRLAADEYLELGALDRATTLIAEAAVIERHIG